MTKLPAKPSIPFYPLRIYMNELTELFSAAKQASDPALFLCRHPARTSLFMAESVARLLHEVYQTKKTARALKLFKKLEDSLGEIDDHDQWLKQFSKVKDIKKEQLAYFSARRDKALERLNKKLSRRDFYGRRFKELALKLDVDFNDTRLIAALEKAIRREAALCLKFYESCAGSFSSMELQVHELRRKLRWLSIYAQSLRGIIVLKTCREKHGWEKEFITKREKESPYNQLTVRRNLQRHIVFDRNVFYALGFVVRELGRIKDKGMKIEVFAEMLRKTRKPADAEREAVKQLGLPYTLAGQLQKADRLLAGFFVREQVYQKLL